MSTTPVRVFGSEDVRVREVGGALKLKLGAKGQGKRPRWSGKRVDVWRSTRGREVVRRAARGIPIHTTGASITGTFGGRALTIVSRPFQGYRGMTISLRVPESDGPVSYA